MVKETDILQRGRRERGLVKETDIYYREGGESDRERKGVGKGNGHLLQRGRERGLVKETDIYYREGGEKGGW